MTPALHPSRKLLKLLSLCSQSDSIITRQSIAHGQPFSISRAHTLEWLTFLSALFHTLDRAS